MSVIICCFQSSTGITKMKYLLKTCCMESYFQNKYNKLNFDCGKLGISLLFWASFFSQFNDIITYVLFILISHSNRIIHAGTRVFKWEEILRDDSNNPLCAYLWIFRPIADQTTNRLTKRVFTALTASRLLYDDLIQMISFNDTATHRV